MATQFAVDLVFKSQGTGKLKDATDKLGKLEQKAKGAQQGAAGAANGIRGFGRAASGAAGGVRVFGAAIQAALGPLAIAGTAVSALAAAFQTLAQQDFAEAKVRSLGTNSKELVGELKKVSAELKGQASVTELTGAAYDVASAGFVKAADAAKVLKAASLGATGGFSDINTVGNAATSVLNAYGLSADHAASLVDKFIQTQNDGKIVVAQYAQNIGKVAAAAAGLGIPLSEVNAVIAQATASGVQAEVAFTGLKGALARLASGDAGKELESFGIKVDAATIESEGLYGTLKKLEGLDVGTLFKVLGTEAGPALIPVIKNLERYSELIKKQEGSAGAAARAQAEAANTIQGAWTSVQTAVSNFFGEQSALGEALKVTLQVLAFILDDVGKKLNFLLGPLKNTLSSLSALVSGAMQVRDAFLTAFAESQSGQALLQLFEKIQAVLASLTEKIKGPLVQAFGLLLKGAQKLAQFLADVLFKAIDGLIKRVVAIGKNLPFIGNSVKKLGAAWEQIKEKVSAAADAVGESKKKTEGLSEDALKRLEAERNIDAIMRGQLDTATSLEAQERIRLNAAKTRLDNENLVANAMYGALLKVNDLEMQRAQNSGDVEKQYKLQLQKAELIYKQSVLQIQSEIRKAELGALQVKIELQKLKAAVQLKAVKGEVTKADYDALALQKQALDLAMEGVDAARQAAMYHMQGADAIRRMTVEQAAFNRTQAAGRAAGGGGAGGGGGASGSAMVTRLGTTRSIGSASTSELASKLSALGISGVFTASQAAGVIRGKFDERVAKYQSATRGTPQFSQYPTERQLQAKGFAQGGFVNHPTNAIIGEAGDSEYVIPSRKMDAAMSRYASGVRGEGVVAGASSSGDSTAMAASGGRTAVNITTGPVLRVDNTDYVKVADMQRGMAAAANAGQANTMRSMSRSYAARRSMGL